MATSGSISAGGKSAGGNSTVSGGASSQSGGAATNGGQSTHAGQSGAVGLGGATSAGGSSAAGRSSTGGSTSSAGKSATGGATATGGKAGGGATATGGKAGGGATATGGATNTAGASSTGGSTVAGGAAGAAGATITTHCSNALPAEGKPADVSSPTTVVGTGTAESCTFAALNAAVTKGGIITFACGEAPTTIAVTATMNLPINKSTVIDGGNKITLDGESKVQLLRFQDPDWMKNNNRLTLQHLTVINGKTNPVEQIPTRPAPCSQGYNDGEGGAIFMRNGNMSIIDCVFSNNQAAPLGPDTGGGAIYILGSKNGLVIAHSLFTNNSASNAGAVGGLFSNLSIYDSLFRNNKATGNGANNNDPSQCDYINNDQNEIGSGGNGGAIYQDGGSATNIILCGVEVTNNAAGTKAFGGGVFMTSNDWTGTLTIQDSTITGNTGGSWTQVQEGSVTNVGTAFGVNALSITVKNSTLQGVK